MKHAHIFSVLILSLAITACGGGGSKKVGGGGSSSSSAGVSSAVLDELDGADTTYDSGSSYDDGSYDDGYSDGYDDGYSDGNSSGNGSGYDSGYNDGYDDGYYDGDGDGYSSGYDDGYDDGYDWGYNDGYYDGSSSDWTYVFEKNQKHRKDRLKMLAEEEGKLIDRVSTNLSTQFGLSQERSGEVAKLVVLWNKTPKERGADEINDKFTKEILGHSLTEYTNAYLKKSQDQSAELNQLIEDTAELNGIEVNHAHELLNKFVNTYMGAQ